MCMCRLPARGNPKREMDNPTRLRQTATSQFTVSMRCLTGLCCICSLPVCGACRPPFFANHLSRTCVAFRSFMFGSKKLVIVGLPIFHDSGAVILIRDSAHVQQTNTTLDVLQESQIGTSMVTGNYQCYGLVSPSSPC